MTDNLTWPTFKVPQAAIEAARKAIKKAWLSQNAPDPVGIDLDADLLASAALQAAAPFMQSVKLSETDQRKLRFIYEQTQVAKLSLSKRDFPSSVNFLGHDPKAEEMKDRQYVETVSYLLSLLGLDGLRALADRKPEVKE